MARPQRTTNRSVKRLGSCGLLGALLTVVAPLASRASARPADARLAAYAQASARPVNLSPPAVSGSATPGAQLAASPGTWSREPTSFAYRWIRCDTSGTRCRRIRGATASAYTVAASDIGHRLAVTVVAYNQAGHSRRAKSAPGALVGGGGLEYVLEDGTISVYDDAQEFKFVKTISLPQTKAGVRGVTVAPSTHEMFVSFGGDGGGNGNGSVLAYDLVNERLSWEVHLGTGIDSGQVSPDGSKLYMPTGELSESGVWNILSTSGGEMIGTIQGGAGAHNTVVSKDGRYVYLGGRNYNYLDVYETATGAIRKLGPLVGTVRPLTANGKNTLAFTTATGFDGFQVSSVTSGKVLFTVSFGEVPSGFPFTAPSHGISLSPDEREVYVLDAVHKEVQFWNVAGVAEGIAPTQIGVVPVKGLSGSESSCAYDCGRDGWIQSSRDGSLLFVGDSGEVIDTQARKVIAMLPALANTRKSIEIDWQGGVPVATSGRTGVGYVE